MPHEIKTVPGEEILLLYSDDEKDAERGCIGHLRQDFGHQGKEFWTTWFDHCGELKTQDFKDELDTVVNYLRQNGNMLNSLAALAEYCYKHKDARLDERYSSNAYGFKIDTDTHSYYIRGMLTQGDFNMYCYCYRRDKLEQHLAESPAKACNGEE